MKKTISVFLVALIICLSVLPTAFAQNNTYIFDETNTLSESELDEANKLANEIYEQTSYGVYFYKASSDINISSKAEDIFKEICNNENSVLFFVNSSENDWCIYLSGKASDLITGDEKNEFWRLYRDKDDSFQGVLAYLREAKFFISLYNEELSSFTTDIEYTSSKFVNDYANVISSSCEDKLERKIHNLREELNVDMVIVTTDDTNGMNSHNFCNEFYRSNGYGYGASEYDDGDGLVILLNLDGGREIYMTVYGKCDYAMYDYGIDYATEMFVDAFGEDGYDGAFEAIIGVCEMFMDKAENDEPYTKNDIQELESNYKKHYASKEPYHVLMCLIISAVVGLIASLVTVSVWKSQLTSVKFDNSARAYIVNGSRILRENKDTYLYSNVTKTRRVESSSSSSGGGGHSGGSFHSSSSGGSHGGGRSF